MKKIRQLFTDGWKFHLGDYKVLHPVKSGMTGGLTSSEEVEEGEWLKIAYFDECEIEKPEESEWRAVSIPHDWCVEGDYRNDEGEVKHHRSHGYLDAGIGFYRKTFQVPEEWNDKTIGLEFEGVFRNCTIWVNGFEVLNHQSGYNGFWCELTDILRYGKEGANVILVRVDASEYEGWWYEGAGIYRKVWLEAKEPVYVQRHGIYIASANVADEKADIKTEIVLCNETNEPQNCELHARIVNVEGFVLNTNAYQVSMLEKEMAKCEFENVVRNPVRWSPEHPNLYKLEVTVVWNGEEVENAVTEFGIKTVEFDSEKGFLLNGEPYLLKGTCNHQDFAGVGIALPDSLIEYKLKKLKDMGCNAYRSSHHPAAEKLLEVCDHIGLLVMNENRKLDSTEQGIKELKEMIYSSRNHASIFMWSMENEEILEGTIMGARVLQTLTDITHKLDPYHPVTAAMNHGWNEGGYSDVVDVVGYNYGQRSKQDVMDHQRLPDLKSLGTESASCTITRGIYQENEEAGYCSEYGTMIPEWGCTVEKAWTDVLEHQELSGAFIWTGFDYRGEPTPFSWPNINSHFGVMDTCGFPKSTYYYLKSHWTNTPVLFMMPHWNWEGDEGKDKKIWIETNCEEVELFLNGVSFDKKRREGAVHLEWKVMYEPGTLEAAGYIQGKECIRSQIETAQEPRYIELHPEKNSAIADGEDTICVEITLSDEQRRPVVTMDRKIRFQVEGSASILGVGNGDPSCHEPDKAAERSTFNGKCLVILQTKKHPGHIVLRASADGMEDTILELKGV